MRNANIQIDSIKAQILSKLVAKNGSTFVGISEYVNSSNEISNQVVVANFLYGKAVEKDVETLKSATDVDCKNIADWTVKQANKTGFDRLDRSYTTAEVREMINGRIERFLNPNKKKSDAQKDIYTNIEGTTLRILNETGEVCMYALQVHKEILQEGEYKERKRKSADKVTIERYFNKYFNLRTAKFRNFKLSADKLNKIALTGDSFTFK